MENNTKRTDDKHAEMTNVRRLADQVNEMATGKKPFCGMSSENKSNLRKNCKKILPGILPGMEDSKLLPPSFVKPPLLAKPIMLDVFHIATAFIIGFCLGIITCLTQR